MSADRKKKLRERQTRLKKLLQRHPDVQAAAWEPLNFRREADYIVARAQEHDGRCVTFGVLLFFSTHFSDAWMLDLEDGFALCLARDGQPLPLALVETHGQTSVEWDRTFSIEGDAFITTELETGRISTVMGYPIQAILAAIQLAEEANG